jgi:hypothetical protein
VPAPRRTLRPLTARAQTDDAHGLAWHAYDYHGRVRPWDGLVTLVRVPRDRRQGRLVLRGYVVGGTTFVGAWRAWADEPPAAVPWEGPVILSRQEDGAGGVAA